MTVKSEIDKVSVTERLKELLFGLGIQMANYAIIFVLALTIGALVILLSGKDPLAAYKALSPVRV